MIKTIAIQGTGLKGYVNITYDEIVSKLGKEHFGASGDNKMLAEWSFKFDDGTVATLYNYKNYDSVDGLDLEDITEWNIGGNSKLAVYHLGKALGTLDTKLATW